MIDKNIEKLKGVIKGVLHALFFSRNVLSYRLNLAALL
ncbi:hypothetical protein HMPREF1054_1491 [Haemophilus paraphrohaemolyticus HK411]|uniref:Uncharacterized protein n=1 Tax=Haemophilus paraphrohaemolyticus HK411 TaxID=1095743 RepID=I2NPD0_9PAST|nr:hypothetical protein HMPREF1054_1491 [Haemophilus paraphrohaemolyticus HK411]